MTELISIILAAVLLLYMAVALLTGTVTGGQFIGAIILALVAVNVIDYFKERRQKRHEQAADAGTEKEDC